MKIRVWTHHKGATDICEGGAHIIRTHLTVGVSLSTVLTASKGNENVLLTRVSARDKIRGKGGLSEKDAFEVCDGCVRRRGIHQNKGTVLDLWAFHYFKDLRRHTKVMKCTSHKF